MPGLLLLALAASLPVHAGQQHAGAPPAPEPLTAEQDHKRIMDLLKISGFPPGAVRAGHTPNPTWPTFLSFADRYFAPDADRR